MCGIGICHDRYSANCLNRILNKMESCFSLTLNKFPMWETFVNLTFINRTLVYSLRTQELIGNEVQFRQVSLYQLICFRIISINEEKDDLPTLYWTPRLHNNSYRERALLILILGQQNNWIMTKLVSAVRDYNNTFTKSSHVVTSIKCGYWKNQQPFPMKILKSV